MKKVRKTADRLENMNRSLSRLGTPVTVESPHDVDAENNHSNIICYRNVKCEKWFKVMLCRKVDERDAF